MAAAVPEAGRVLGRRAREAQGGADPAPARARVATAPGRTLRAPIFLLGSHKSGASLLRSLLDGHPELFCIPLETHFFQHSGHWVDYPLRRSWPRAMDRNAARAALVAAVREYQEKPDRTGDAVLAGRIDLALLRAALEAGSWGKPPERFATVADALHHALSGAALPEGLRVVEKSVEHAEFAPHLRRMFPDARFVHVVRSPYASLVATRRAKARRGHPYLGRIARSLRSSFLHLDRNTALLDGYLVLRYEDLVRAPAEAMARVAEFLGIEFCDSLLAPTLLGKPWRGNSTGGHAFRGVSTRPVDAWRREIRPHEIWLVNQLLGPAPQRWGYPRLEVGRTAALLPARGETPLVWLRNRALFWTL
jgi:hypothetical protein